MANSRGFGTALTVRGLARSLDLDRTLELDKFHTPDAIRVGPVNVPVNALGLRRVMFAVEDIAEVIARMRADGPELIGELRYEDAYRLAYVRGPEGIIVGLAEAL